MVERDIKVTLKSGLQARPAAIFVQEATNYVSEVYIEKEGRRVNAKSIMGIMGLAIHSGADIKLIIDGSDELEALKTLEKLL
ncbi:MULTISPECIES: HPr family phosphocarrier protein [Bacillaceae]|uniref:HPr family phosphocarrier protein n=1 Tax=Bacillaceae TaxID=186817 RepID=UPI001E4A1B9D|nr:MULTISPECIES: HPr family phosphocarrier protein [Bacillaceae]MCE4050360.1 HPr family phosphocarrier protein [Bacillus sp. Au-Bac7]MCM3029596.1 HPr family phosphocarrier protein [Niallia sp. MER 6]MDL0437076.1 HPr family phosphocarrier protein [Niallia sp. SS-2023]UPO87131.1 HPr family phosphocarrier protein [Niallia sp. Man26]